MATRPSVRLVGSAGPGEGRGHAGRLVTMAEALAPRADVRVELLLGAFTTGEAERLAAAGIDWRNGGARREPDAVIVDVPWPDAIAARWRADRLVVFDDSHRLSANVAVVVQPSLPAWHGAARASTILAGYAFAPIRPSIRRLASEDLVPAAPAEVVVCFGGGDPADVTARVAPAIAAAVGQRAHLTIVVGASYAGALRDERGGELVRDPADLDERVARSTLAVIGGGMMKQEAAHLGVPTITVAVADDQLVVAPAFAATGATRYLGDGRVLDPATVAEAVVNLLGDDAARIAMREAGRRAVDGRGADRVADAVVALARRG